jgi:hypothetical protein
MGERGYAMTRKILLFLAAGMFVATLGGVALAVAPVLEVSPPDAAIHSSAADPEWTLGQGESWQEREPVETGSMPAMRGNSPDVVCCAGENGTSVDALGRTVIRPGIDDGP